MKTDIYKNIKELNTWALDEEIKLVTHLNIQEKIDDIHIMYLRALSKLFGVSNDANDKGELKSKFEFNAKDFILLSFKSYKGQIPSSPEVAAIANKINRRRYNLYRKGRIWSQEDYKYGRNFYYFLDKINDAFYDIPINFISYCVHKYRQNPTRHHTIITQNLQKAEDKNLLFFPTEAELRTLGDDNLNQTLDIFSLHLKDDYLNDPFPNEILEKQKIKLDQLKPHLKALANNDLFKTITNRYCSYFGINISSLSDIIENNQSIQEKIILMAVSYSYNHLPYDLHLFYPITDNLELDNLFTIMVAINPDSTFESEDIELFKNIITYSPNIPKHEFKLNQNAKDTTESLIRWKYIYEQNLDKYSTFMNAVENICKSLCKRHDIKGEISSRLKTFESFYNKLIEKANNDKKLSERYTYKDAISKPNEIKDLVFKHIRDIAGVRIICFYNDNVQLLEDIFQSATKEDNLKEGDLKCSDFKDRGKVPPASDNDEDGYRGFHLTVQPGEERRKLVEYQNIDFVQCEIQIRTNFAHGWAVVAHPMMYKDDLHLEIIDKPFREELKNDLVEISESLKNHDKDIAILKNRRGEYKFTLDE